MTYELFKTESSTESARIVILDYSSKPMSAAMKILLLGSK